MESTDAGSGAQRDAGQDSDTAGAPDLDQIRAELDALKEQRLREHAELENQRRRVARDLENARRYANERLLGDLLPVLDSLERGLEAGGNEVARLREGIELTLRQLLKVAEDNGLLVIDPAGQAFDPEQHQAMSTVTSPDHEPGSVVQVYQKGYVLNGRLLRPALVVVAKEPE